VVGIFHVETAQGPRAGENRNCPCHVCVHLGTRGVLCYDTLIPTLPRVALLILQPQVGELSEREWTHNYFAVKDLEFNRDEVYIGNWALNKLPVPVDSL
jgi:hypothetical protein